MTMIFVALVLRVTVAAVFVIPVFLMTVIFVVLVLRVTVAAVFVIPVFLVAVIFVVLVLRVTVAVVFVIPVFLVTVIFVVIVLVITMRISVVILERDGFHTLGRDNPHTLEARRVDQAINPAFEFETVYEKNFRAANRTRIRRCRLIDMRVSIGTHKRRYGDMLAANLFDQIAQDRKRRHHRYRLGLLPKRRAGQQNSGQGGPGLQH